MSLSITIPVPGVRWLSRVPSSMSRAANVRCSPAAAPLLDAAAGHARYAGGPLLRAWLHCVHSEVSARTGTPAQTVRHARQAEDSLSTRGEDPEWLDFFNPARLAGFLGYSELVAGRPADAVISLHRALDQLDDRAGKQRSVVLLDLAAALAVTDAEHGMDFAAQAFDQLKIEPYGTAYGRIPAVRRALEGTPQERLLEERIRSLPAAVC